MKSARTFAAAALLLVLGPLAMAQGSGQGDPQMRMRLRENISTLYLLRLTRALELSEDQTSRLFPVLTRIEREKAEMQRRMNVDLLALREVLAGPGRDDGRLLEIVARIRGERRSIREKDDETEAVLEEVLSPVQKAKYLLFTVEFYRTLGHQLERARQLKPGLKRRP